MICLEMVMQINDSSSSLYEYYLELLKQRKAAEAAADSTANPFATANSIANDGVAVSSFASVLAQAGATGADGEAATETVSATAVIERPPPPPPPSLSVEGLKTMFAEADDENDILSPERLGARPPGGRPPEVLQTDDQETSDALLSLLETTSGDTPPGLPLPVWLQPACLRKG